LVVPCIALILTACDTGAGGPAASTAASPSFTPMACGTYSGRGCALASKRVDLAKPSFENPTQITSSSPSATSTRCCYSGTSTASRFGRRRPCSPEQKKVTWDGKEIPVLVSQYIAYLDGRITEAAIDRYAQADDGSVWYLGEDVFDYENGMVTLTEGTWLAGEEGPAAMIMPAEPKVGDYSGPRTSREWYSKRSRSSRSTRTES
jgi:hypothetical protein